MRFIVGDILSVSLIGNLRAGRVDLDWKLLTSCVNFANCTKYAKKHQFCAFFAKMGILSKKVGQEPSGAHTSW